MRLNLSEAATTLSEAGQKLYEKGWVPATSGNFSLRVDGNHIAITVSGSDKGRLAEKDIMAVDMSGRSTSDRQASAELGLHLQLYRRDPGIGAVLHTHSLNSTVGSARVREGLRFEGLELLKAFEGIRTHESELSVPVFENTQNIDALAAEVEQHMERHGQGYAYLIRRHGVYTWASSMQACLRHLEALEYLLEYHALSNGVTR